MSPVDLVEIHFQKLRLGIANLEIRGQGRLQNFASPGAANIEENRTCQLLTDGACSLTQLHMAKIHTECARDPDEIECAVLEKAFVFHGEHRPRYVRRKFCDAHLR